MLMVSLALPFSFEQPPWLWLLLLIPALVLASLRSLAGLDPLRRVLALAVRAGVVALLVACLARVQFVRRNEDVTVMFLMDRSFSCEGMTAQVEEFLTAVAKPGEIPKNDRVGMIDFAREGFLQQLPMTGGYHIEPGRLPQMPGTDHTDLSAAVRLAMAMFPHDAAKRVVLISDGNENLGDILTEARRAKADGIVIDVVPLHYEKTNDVGFDRLIAPSRAEKGEQVPIRMVLSTHRRVSGTVDVYQNGELVQIPGNDAHIELSPGTNTMFLRLPVNETGAQVFEARFRPDDETLDAVTFNNNATTFSFVSGPSRILFLSKDLPADAPLIDALRSENIEVEPVEAASAALDLLKLQSYSAIILANVPASDFTDDQMKDMAAYVKDMGGGLVMLGGDEGFGAGGWIGTPIEEIMPVSFEIKHKRVIPRGALVIICHSCEIPRGNYWGKEMAKKSVDTVSSRDYLGVLAYSYSPGGVSWEVPLAEAANKGAVKARIDRMQNGDMPDFDSTMQMAYDGLTTGRGRDAAQKHVIIISDGDPSAPNRGLIQSYKNAGITVSTIGIGWGAHVMTTELQRIATDTGGRFYSPKSPNQLPQIFTKESKVVRRSLITEEAFRPRVFHSLSDLLAGVPPEDVPVLGGLVLTSPKESTNVQLPLVRSTEDGDDPVLAHWQYELGKTVAFTSGQWPRWGNAWTSWPQYSKLWAQIVRWCMRQDAPANFDTYTRVEGGKGRVVIDALDKDAAYLNFLQFRSLVTQPDRKAVPLEFKQTGPGHYEAEFDVDQMGQYLVTSQVLEGGEARGAIQTGVSAPYSPEYRDLTTNMPLLSSIADITGGTVMELDAKTAKPFRKDLPPTESHRPAWEFVLAWMLLPLFLLDVAVRRLASWLALSIAVEVVVLAFLLFGLNWAVHPTFFGIVRGAALAFVLAEVVGWAIRWRYIRSIFDYFTHGTVALAQAGERSTASLEQLRGTHDRVKEDLASDKASGVRRIAKKEPAEQAATGRERYDVGEEAAKAPAGDLAEAVGGAKSGVAPPAEKRRKPAGAGGAEQPEEETTSRLLAAKRKAREGLDKKE
ncbi:MAG: VWA domain-containing protein [Phycisphaerales bacterium]|nr:VWA domain-containing protein [Phycisphaerales bacterium]